MKKKYIQNTTYAFNTRSHKHHSSKQEVKIFSETLRNQFKINIDPEDQFVWETSQILETIFG